MPLVLHRLNCRRQRRRGVGTLLFMVFLAIFIMLLVLVVNYTYLAYSQLRTAEVTDTLARIAVTELLDEHLLDNAAPNQADDVDASEVVVDVYLDKMNAMAAANQQLRYTIGSSNPADTDISVTAGRVDDLTKPVTDSGASATFDSTPAAGELLNTLRIEATRSKTGANPLYLFIRAAFTPQAADIGTMSFASLDSRILGFRPTDTTPTPIVPIAIKQDFWLNASRSQKGGKPRLDFTAELKSSGNGSLVMVNFDQDAVVNPTQIAAQIQDGVYPDDINLPGSDYLGPIVPGVISQDFPSDDIAPTTSGTALAQAFNNIVGERRIFPLFDINWAPGGNTNNGNHNGAFNGSNGSNGNHFGMYNGTSGGARTIGFVAATVLGAQWQGNDLKLDLEPEFVVHFTAVTDRHFDNGTTTVDVPENVYVHKLRLSR